MTKTQLRNEFEMWWLEAAVRRGDAPLRTHSEMLLTNIVLHWVVENYDLIKPKTNSSNAPEGVH